jgi:hypothetical protein
MAKTAPAAVDAINTTVVGLLARATNEENNQVLLILILTPYFLYKGSGA